MAFLMGRERERERERLTWFMLTIYAHEGKFLTTTFCYIELCITLNPI